MIEQQVHQGRFAIQQLYPLLEKTSLTGVFLVRGKKSYVSSGAKYQMEQILSNFDCPVFEYFEFEENPKFEDLEKGVNLLESTGASIVIAIGGGSVLDMAKLIRFFYSYNGDLEKGNFNKKRELLPLIAIPTTAGTGCEATRFAVLYKSKVKYSVDHIDILPDIAIVDPVFTYNNPKYLTACTGFDALAQAIEAFWNINATEKSDEYAMRAIQLLWPNLPIVVNSPTEDSRNKMSEGSYWAGKAINITRTTAPHAMSYAFTAYYGYPHGHAVSLTFPFWMEYNLKYMTDQSKAEFLVNMLNLPESVFLFLVDYIRKIGLELRGLVDIDKNIILTSVNIQRLRNNPVEVDLSVLEESIYKSFITS